MKRDVMIFGDLVAQPGIRREERPRRLAIPATARRHEPIDLRQLRRRALLEQPVRHGAVAIQLGDGVGRAAIGARTPDLGPVGDHRLGQRHVPRARHHVQRRLAVLGEYGIRIGAVLE